MACGIAKMVVVAVLVADLISPRVAIKLPEPTTAAVIETTQTQHTQSVGSVETVPPVTVQTTESVSSDYSRGFVHYRVGECVPPYEWQWYLYGKLADRGLEWFYPTAVCQIYQESNWNQWSDNGRDFGLCQQKGIYWDSRAAAAGIPGADIWDPYAQMYVYTWMMSEYLRATGYNVNQALSMYYTGTWDYSETYVGHVIRWMDYLEVVK